MPLDARRLGRLLRRLATLASAGGGAAAASGCCTPYFEEWRAGSSWSRVEAMPPDVASTAPAPERELPREVCARVCGGTAVCFPATLEGPSGVVSDVVVCNEFIAGGCHDTGVFRMPSGRRAAILRRGTPGAAWLALAGAEAASIGDFRRLARELQRAGAPRRLVVGSLAAADDEIRHERVLRRIAARTGAVSRAVGPISRRADVVTPRRRDLASLARENVALGCVGESWGALLLEVQSRTATDSDVRRALARIAQDETRHAALAFDLHAWAWRRLDARGRASVRRALGRSLAALRRVADVDPDLAVALALPSAPTRRALADALARVVRVALADAPPSRPASTGGQSRRRTARASTSTRVAPSSTARTSDHPSRM